MIILYAILSIFLLISGFFSYPGFFSSIYVNSMAQNIFSELIGIIVTLLLIDKFMEWNDEKENKRMNQIAFKYLRIEIASYLRMLCRLYKASVEEKNATKLSCNDVDKFFDENYFSVILRLNHNKKVPDITEDFTYLEYMMDRANDLRVSMEKTFILYEKYLSSEVTEKMDDLMECDFIKILRILSKTTKLGIKPYSELNNIFDNDNSVLPAFRYHVSKFIWLLNHYNKVTNNAHPITLSEEAWEVKPILFGSALDENCARDPKTDIRKILNTN